MIQRMLAQSAEYWLWLYLSRRGVATLPEVTRAEKVMTAESGEPFPGASVTPHASSRQAFML